MRINDYNLKWEYKLKICSRNDSTTNNFAKLRHMALTQCPITHDFDLIEEDNFLLMDTGCPLFGSKTTFCFDVLYCKITNEQQGLATLLEGAGLAFDIVFKFSKIDYGCFKAVKLVKNVIIVINGVPTIYLWKKNEEKKL